MKLCHFHCQTEIGANADEVYNWHARQGALERLNPPWIDFKIVEHTEGLKEGGILLCRITKGPISLCGLFRHVAAVAGRSFSDHQVRGPFSQWDHIHHFIPQDNHSSLLRDEVSYSWPFGNIGHWFGEAFCKWQLEKMFAYRHRIVRREVCFHKKYNLKPLTIALTGASGLVGRSLAAFLSSGGHTLKIFSRRRTDPAIPAVSTCYWNPCTNELNPLDLEGVDVIINLSGESVSAHRWNEEIKGRIRFSRIMAAQTICAALAKTKNPPRILLNASAIGYYGERGVEELNEEGTAGKGFLADVCREWEEAAAGAANLGIRCVSLRLGVVLTPQGGALRRMLFPFKCCLGGRVGSGEQFMSWIAIDDVLGAILHVIATPNISGVCNLTAPHPVTNREFTTLLASALQRPALFPIPAAAMRLIFGEMADAIVLRSSRVLPKKLIDSNYSFFCPTLAKAFQHLL